MTTPKKRRTDAWGGNVGNEKRRAKMRTLTLSDEAWEKLERIAGERGRSAFVEEWIMGLTEADRVFDAVLAGAVDRFEKSLENLAHITGQKKRSRKP